MPREAFGAGSTFLGRGDLLSFEEIERLARIFVSQGVRKIRLTGGEPLLRKDLPALVAMLSRIPGIEIALTTNGSLLAEQAQALADAGLQRITVSLDSLDERVFRAMNDVDFPAARVLDGIEAAAKAGLTPLKVNAVIRRGVNDHTVLDLARHFRGTEHIVRFIEYMDVGNSNEWQLDDVVSGSEIVRLISAEMPLERLPANYPGEVAQRWRYAVPGGADAGRAQAEVGVITSVTQPFCGACTRARLSPDGRLYTCLFATVGTDLRSLVRGGSDAAIADEILRVWSARDDRYSEQRTGAPVTGSRIEMSYIGG
jgi:cyclic pyranopterin phosphate synthase